MVTDIIMVNESVMVNGVSKVVEFRSGDIAAVVAENTNTQGMNHLKKRFVDCTDVNLYF